jgi:hypothetical protein
LRRVTAATFHLILTCLPCPARLASGDTCRKTCQKIVENFIQVRLVAEIDSGAVGEITVYR